MDALGEKRGKNAILKSGHSHKVYKNQTASTK